MIRLSKSIAVALAAILIGASGAPVRATDAGDVYIDGVRYVPADSKEAKKASSNSGKMVSHTFSVSSNFSSIASSAPVNIVFTQAVVSKPTVKGDLPKKLLDVIDITVSKGVLNISLKSGNHSFNFRGKTPTLYISTKDLKNVSIMGAGDFTIPGSLASDSFNVNSCGSGDFKANNVNAGNKNIYINTQGSGDVDIKTLKCNALTINVCGSGDVESDKVNVNTCTATVQGSGDIELKGSANTITFSATGSGDIKAGYLKANNGTASAQGSGDIKCNVTNLTKHASGSGDISNYSH